MRRNVEVKVQVASLDPLRRALRRLGARGPRILEQTDTYFGAGDRRLKLRAEASEGSRRLELIGYLRPDRGIRTSAFEIAALPPAAGAALTRALAHALAIRAVVRKRRELWMLGRDRIHLDRVRRLGAFLEIEAPAAEGPAAIARARRRTASLLERLGLAGRRPIPGSYVDLMERR